jgi:hypothetical protein
MVISSAKAYVSRRCAGARLVYVRRSLPLAGKEEQTEGEQAEAGVRRDARLAAHHRRPYPIATA